MNIRSSVQLTLRHSGKDREAAGRELAVQGHPHRVHLHVTSMSRDRTHHKKVKAVMDSLTVACVKLNGDSRCHW